MIHFHRYKKVREVSLDVTATALLDTYTNVRIQKAMWVDDEVVS